MRRTGTLWVMLLSLLLSGCAPHASEPDGMALVRVLGVNGGDRVTLTAVCGASNQEPPVWGSASAEGFQAAREQLPWSGTRELALTSLSYLIINKDTDLEEVLTCFLADRELSPAASVWYAEDAAELLNGCEDPVARLEVLAEGGSSPPTAADVLAEWKTTGAVYLPVLILKEGQLEMAGDICWEGNL